MTLIYATTYLKNVTFIDNRSPGISNIAIIFGGDALFESIFVANSGNFLA